MSSLTQGTQNINLGNLINQKASATNGLNKTQMAAYNKQMLSAVQDIKPLIQTESDKLTVAAVVPGALGKLQPSGTDHDQDNYVEALQEKLRTVGEDGQLANVDMQNMLQKQQQSLQMMSNISKMLHDTAMSVIRKIGG